MRRSRNKAAVALARKLAVAASHVLMGAILSVPSIAKSACMAKSSSLPPNSVFPPSAAWDLIPKTTSSKSNSMFLKATLRNLQDGEPRFPNSSS